MADDQDKSQKTEEPTPRKLQEARKKGDVPKSQEIPAWFVLATGLGVIGLLGPAIAGNMSGVLRRFLAQAHEIGLDRGAAMALIQSAALNVAGVVFFAFFLLAAAGLAGHLVQHGVLFTAEKIKPKLSKISPVEGFKRIFGPQGVANFLKGIGKLTVVSCAALLVLWPKRDMLAGLPGMDLSQILFTVRGAAVELLFAALAAYAVIAALDYLFQRQSFMKRNRMSRREIRDELKQTEGDPMIRAKLRQIRQERARRRMMAAVPEATVVITNPTHFAVALKYEEGRGHAPVCVAKGVDAVALRIRELAEEHDVPVVEDPPLARALHASVEIDEPIPLEHYKAVARVIGFVLSVARDRGRARARQPG
ncbi:MAG: flagellar biosynthesis protein FlhB [Maricaulaceae bacterium]|nr:flagellar biosynthesis protein FlhB [Maricaulaceae bacterium]